jgi:hypothetical protein
LRCAAEPGRSPEEPNLWLRSQEANTRKGRRRDGRSPKPALLCQLSPSSSGACRTYLVERAMAEGVNEGRKREVSSINGLPFCSPARQFAIFFYRFWVIHFAGAMILSHSFWGPWSWR